MKAFSLLAVGALFGMSAVAFAESPWDGFSDYNDFEDWYSEAAVDMWEEGVITGYEDGSFGAGNTVNRAELAVILDRYTENVLEQEVQSYFDAEIMDILAAVEQMTDFDFDSDTAMAAVVMAEAGLKELESAPDSELIVETNWALPERYTGYWLDTGAESGAPFYLHYEGVVFEDDTEDNFDAWYGPFFVLNPDKL